MVCGCHPLAHQERRRQVSRRSHRHPRHQHHAHIIAMRRRRRHAHTIAMRRCRHAHRTRVVANTPSRRVAQLCGCLGTRSVSEEIWYRVVQIITNHGDELQSYAAQKVWKALSEEKIPHKTLVKVAGCAYQPRCRRPAVEKAHLPRAACTHLLRRRLLLLLWATAACLSGAVTA